MNIENYNSIDEKNTEYFSKDINSHSNNNDHISNEDNENQKKISLQREKITVYDDKNTNVNERKLEVIKNDNISFKKFFNGNEGSPTKLGCVDDSVNSKKLEVKDSLISFQKISHGGENTIKKIENPKSEGNEENIDLKEEVESHPNNSSNKVNYSKEPFKIKPSDDSYNLEKLGEKSNNKLQDNLNLAELIYEEINGAILYSSNRLITRYPEFKKLMQENKTNILNENSKQIRNKIKDTNNLIRYWVNKEYENLESSEKTDFNRAKIWAKFSEKAAMGNCTAMATLAFVRLLEKGVYDVQIDVVEITNGDHFFLVIGRDPKSDPTNYKTWGKNAIVCDPWQDVEGACFPISEVEKKLYDAMGDSSSGESPKTLFDPQEQSLNIITSNIFTPHDLEEELLNFLQKNYPEMEGIEYEEKEEKYNVLVEKLEEFISSPSQLDKIKLADDLIEVIEGDFELKDFTATKTLCQQLTYFKTVVPKNDLKEDLKTAKYLLKRQESYFADLKDNKDSILEKINQEFKFVQSLAKDQALKDIDSLIGKELIKFNPAEQTQFKQQEIRAKLTVKRQEIRAKLIEEHSLKSEERAAAAFFELLNKGFFNTPLDMVQLENSPHYFLVIGRDPNSDPNNDKTWGENAVVYDLSGKQTFSLKEIQSGKVEVQEDGTLLHPKDNFSKLPKNFRRIISNISFPNELSADPQSEVYNIINDIKQQLKYFHGTSRSYQKTLLAKSIIKKIETNFKKFENLESIQTLRQQLHYFIKVNAKH